LAGETVAFVDLARACSEAVADRGVYVEESEEGRREERGEEEVGGEE
jgi:hypothetical protein